MAEEADERHLRFVLAPNVTPASSILSQQAAAAAGLALRVLCSQRFRHQAGERHPKSCVQQLHNLCARSVR